MSRGDPIAEPLRIADSGKGPGLREVADADLMAAYVERFLGYGDLAAPFWFVGLEHGGDPEELSRRLAAWDRRGRAAIEDLAEYHKAFGHDRWLQPKAPTQPTWRGLIRVVAGAQGWQANIEAIRQYQREKLGRRGGETCLLELLPLPSRDVDTWDYALLAPLCSWLVSRDKYRGRWQAARAQHIWKLVAEHRPAAVVIYGRTVPAQWWRDTVGARFEQTSLPNVLRTSENRTTVYLAPHPTFFGPSARIYQTLGEWIASERERCA